MFAADRYGILATKARAVAGMSCIAPGPNGDRACCTYFDSCDECMKESGITPSTRRVGDQDQVGIAEVGVERFGGMVAPAGAKLDRLRRGEIR